MPNTRGCGVAKWLHLRGVYTLVIVVGHCCFCRPARLPQLCGIELLCILDGTSCRVSLFESVLEALGIQTPLTVITYVRSTQYGYIDRFSGPCP
jgi:hypothetical protein